MDARTPSRRLSARELSHELRHGRDPDLTRRRWILGLSLVGTLAGQIVALYQMGIVKRLPDLPGRLFDATTVDRQPYAYKRFATPDAVLMLISYGVTAALAAAGGQRRARTMPWLPVALLGKTLYDAVFAVKLGREEYEEAGALCGYCQAATVASIISVALAVPEALRALRGGDSSA